MKTAPENPKKFTIAQKKSVDMKEIYILFALCYVGLVSLMLPEAAKAVGLLILYSAMYGLLLSWKCYNLAAKNTAHLFSALFWFRVGCVAFISVGSCVPFIVNDETLVYMRTIHHFDTANVLRYFVIAEVATLFVLLGDAFTSKFLINNRITKSDALPKNKKDLRNFGYLFIAAGGLIRYGLILPDTYGYFDLNIPGWFVLISNAFYAGIFMIVFSSESFSKPKKYFIMILIFTDIFLHLLTFLKQPVIMTVVSGSLGFIAARFNLRRVLISTLVVFLALYVSQPFVHYGRSQVVGFSSGSAASISERFGILWDYVSTGSGGGGGLEISPLARLSFVNVGTFVIEDYESGNAASPYRDVFAAMVPRIIWPEKPAIGNKGREFYEYVRGREASVSFGIGHFHEAYWWWGWIGVIIIMFINGILLSIVSSIAVWVVANARWVQMPIAFLSIKIGYKITGHWVVDIVGPVATFFVLSVLFYVADGMVSRKRGVNQQGYSVLVMNRHMPGFCRD